MLQALTQSGPCKATLQVRDIPRDLSQLELFLDAGVYLDEVRAAVLTSPTSNLMDASIVEGMELVNLSNSSYSLFSKADSKQVGDFQANSMLLFLL